MHCSPRLQGLAQTRGGQRPEVQVPFAQPQVPPQLSLAPQVPSVGHLGTQQRPCAQRALPEQPQVPPQPFVAPQCRLSVFESMQPVPHSTYGKRH